MKHLTAILVAVLLAVQLQAANVIFYIGPTGQTLYVRITNPAGNYVATALTEGSSGGEGNYTVSEATIAALTGMSSASTGNGCAFRVYVGGTPSTTATDPIAAFGYLPWSGSAEVAQATTGDAYARIGANGAGLTVLATTTGQSTIRNDIAGIATTLGTPAGASVSADILTKPTLAQLLDGTLSGHTTSGTVGKALSNSDVATSSIAGGGFTSTERAQILAALSIGEDIGVPKSLVWVLARKDGDFKPTSIIVKNSGDGVDVAVDFRNVLGSGDAITPDTGITSITLTSGSGLTSPAFSDVTQATLWMNSAVKFHIAAGTPGTTYTVTVVVNTVGGNTLSAPCQVTVK